MQRSLSGGERKRWMIFCFVSCAIMIACLTSPAFASNVWSGTHANDSWDLTGFLDRIMDVYNLIKAICAPWLFVLLLVVDLKFCLEMSRSSQKEWLALSIHSWL